MTSKFYNMKKNVLPTISKLSKIHTNICLCKKVMPFLLMPAHSRTEGKEGNHHFSSHFPHHALTHEGTQVSTCLLSHVSTVLLPRGDFSHVPSGYLYKSAFIDPANLTWLGYEIDIC